MISIIIVNWNGKKYLHECLDSIYDQSYQDFEVILVDNGSTDGSQYNDTRVELVNNYKNLGFTKANNIGVANAKGDWVVFLNYDTVVHKDWLLELMNTALYNSYKYKSPAAACSRILIYNDGSRVWEEGADKDTLVNADGIDVNYLGISWCSNYKRKFEPTEDKEIGCASGCSLMIKKSVFEEIGGMDDDYFMYHDDVDLSLRIRLAGYKIFLSSKSLVSHKYEFKRQTKDKFFNLEKNRLMTLLKCYRKKTLFLLGPAFIFHELCICGYSLISGTIVDKLRSYLYILKNIKSILKKRSRIVRRISDREILTAMKGSICFEEIDNPVLKYVMNPVLSAYFKIAKMII